MRRKFEITNNTPYRTDDLRRFCRMAAAIVWDRPEDKPLVRMTFNERRTSWGYVTGHATLGGTRCTISLPKPVRWTPDEWEKLQETRERNGMARKEYKPPQPPKADLGATLVHEFGHLRGLTHAEMRGAAKWTWKGVPGGYEAWLAHHGWALALPLREMDVKPRAQPRRGLVLVEHRLALAEAALARWEKKSAAAARRVKRLRGKVYYYQRRQAAMKGVK